MNQSWPRSGRRGLTSDPPFFAASLGVVPVSLVPGWLLAGLAAGVLAAANVKPRPWPPAGY